MVLSERARMTRMVAVSSGIAALGLLVIVLVGSKLGGPLALLGALIAGVWLLKLCWVLATDGPEQQAIAATSHLPVRHFFGGSGIALDPERRQVHLFCGGRGGSYAYADVREWETRIQTGGQAIGRGLGVVAHNLSAATANERASGLFVRVRDTEHPRWRIAFPARKREAELERWRERLQQALSE